jgi:UDP-glucose 4-epimerase
MLCNPQKAKLDLNWETEKGIDEMCQDSWKWQKQNPNGY